MMLILKDSNNFNAITIGVNAKKAEVKVSRHKSKPKVM